MKKSILFCLLVSSINISCIYLHNDDDEPPYTSAYEAITIDRETLENSTELISPQPNVKSGKIYVKDHYLIVNEPNEGFHIYNNSDPEAPSKIGFLKVLGSTDLSIKNNVVYANNAVDLIAIKINTDFNEISVTKRVKNIFPEKVSPDGYTNNKPNNEIVIDWVLKTN